MPLWLGLSPLPPQKKLGMRTRLGICSSNFGANCLFLPSDLSNLLMIAHSFWATWAYCSWSLICPEPPEPFTHFAHKEWVNFLKNFKTTVQNVQKIQFFRILSKSLILCERKRKIRDLLKKPSNSLIRSIVLSESLTFAHLSWPWVMWANERLSKWVMSDEQMSDERWANEWIPNPAWGGLMSSVNSWHCFSLWCYCILYVEKYKCITKCINVCCNL